MMKIFIFDYMFVFFVLGPPRILTSIHQDLGKLEIMSVCHVFCGNSNCIQCQLVISTIYIYAYALVLLVLSFPRPDFRPTIHIYLTVHLRLLTPFLQKVIVCITCRQYIYTTHHKIFIVKDFVAFIFEIVHEDLQLKEWEY